MQAFVNRIFSQIPFIPTLNAWWKMALKIRAEQADDEQAIFDLTTVAFRPVSYSDGSEALIINERLSRLESTGPAGCVLIGNPDFYGWFSFRGDGRLHFEELPEKFVQWLSIGEYGLNPGLRIALLISKGEAHQSGSC